LTALGAIVTRYSEMSLTSMLVHKTDYA